MSEQTKLNSEQLAQLPNRSRIMAMSVGLPILCIALYTLFYATNSMGLQVSEKSAIITDKQTFKGSTSYTSKLIGRQNIIQSSNSGEIKLLQVEAAGEKLGIPVSQAEYDKFQIDDPVTIQIRQHRLTGVPEVVSIVSVKKEGR